MGHYGVDYLGRFSVFFGKVRSYDRMGTFDFVVDSLAQVMEQAGTFGLLDIKAQLGSHDAAEKRHFQGVLVNILTV
jgi:hypothetical protein